MNRHIKGLLFWGGALAIIFVFLRNRPFWIYLIWIFAWGGLIQVSDLLVHGWKRRKNKTGKPIGSLDPRLDTPLKARFASLNYLISNFLFLFNPFILAQCCLQIVGTFWERFNGNPVWQAERYKHKVNYILPVAGEWRVYNGGITRETSHSWGIPTQRYAYDLVKFGENGRSFNGNGRKLTDYFCYDAPILAPADGVIVKARDGMHDAPFVGTFWMDCLARNIAGNTVLIKHADGEYCLLAHLRRGSVCVKAGQTVKQGQEIGRCGHSGNSSEPHLHFQFQNGKGFYFSSGLPVKFSRFWRRNGDARSFVEQDYISKGTFVANGE